MAMKYIRYEKFGIVLFEQNIQHSEMANRIKPMNDKLISAGLVSLWAVDDQLEIGASGGSVTLNLPSLDSDADLIKRRLQLY